MIRPRFLYLDAIEDVNEQDDEERRNRNMLKTIKMIIFYWFLVTIVFLSRWYCLYVFAKRHHHQPHQNQHPQQPPQPPQK